MENTICISEELRQKLKSELNEKRYFHSMGTMECAIYLGKKFNLNTDKLAVAGLLHDCAKNMTKEAMAEIMKGLDVDEDNWVNPKTYHAIVGSYVAEKVYGVEDKEILEAIKCHTLGKVNMSDFEKILFLADKIEQNTRNPEFREKILTVIENENLDEALLLCFDETVKSLVERRLKICKTTINVYNELLDKVKKVQKI